MLDVVYNILTIKNKFVVLFICKMLISVLFTFSRV